MLEEHALVRGTEGVRAALAARRHAAKKVRPCDAFALDLRSPAPFWACKRAYTRLICLQAISGIHALPEHGLVVLLSEDGLVHVLDAETLEGQPLPLRWVASRGRRLGKSSNKQGFCHAVLRRAIASQQRIAYSWQWGCQAPAHLPFAWSFTTVSFALCTLCHTAGTQLRHAWLCPWVACLALRWLQSPASAPSGGCCLATPARRAYWINRFGTCCIDLPLLGHVP